MVLVDIGAWPPAVVWIVVGDSREQMCCELSETDDR